MTPGYEKLEDVLSRAVGQAAHGKGKERHVTTVGEPFEKQKICEIARRVGHGYLLGQAIKKAEESCVLDEPAAIRELLGAINYLAADVIILDEQIARETKHGSND